MKVALAVLLAALVSQCQQATTQTQSSSTASAQPQQTVVMTADKKQTATVTAVPAPTPNGKNVLLIMADDFNHWLPEVGYYTEAKTPNLSALAKQGVLFADTSDVSPHCAPSRQAIWSGISPMTDGIDRSDSPYIRDKRGYESVVTMNQLFKQNGYYTFGGGKLYHENVMGTHITDPDNWTAVTTGIVGTQMGTVQTWTDPAADETYSPLWGGFTNGTTWAADSMMARFFANKIQTQPTTQPFFMAVGFIRPHLPWYAPVEYFNMYDPATLPVPKGYLANDLADASGWPASLRWQEIQKAGQWQNGIRAYLAAISYMDYNVGIVLDSLRNSPFAKNTIVVFMGDNGFMLGEKEWFDKVSIQDQANRTTLIIYDPSAKGNGQVSRKVVSLLDVYPTLAQLAGLAKPSTVEGNSLVPLLDDPNRADWDKPIFLRYQSIAMVKTNHWRYIQWGGKSQLYDITVDPYEWNNLYGVKAYRQVGQDLDKLIQQRLK